MANNVYSALAKMPPMMVGGASKKKWHANLIAALRTAVKDRDSAAKAAIDRLDRIYSVEADSASDALKELPSNLLYSYRRPESAPASYIRGVEARAISGMIVDRDGMQTHHNRAPFGVDSRFAWQCAGACGDHARVYVLEGGWSTHQEELAHLQPINLDAHSDQEIMSDQLQVMLQPGIAGTNHGHGSKTIGVLSAHDGDRGSTFDEGLPISLSNGVVGIAPHVQLVLATMTNAPSAFDSVQRIITSAIISAQSRPTVLLIERHINYDKLIDIPSIWPNTALALSWMPWDTIPENYLELVTAVLCGVHVVMPMGNGSLNGQTQVQFLDQIYAKLKYDLEAELGQDLSLHQPLRVGACVRNGDAWNIVGESNFCAATDVFGPNPIYTTDDTGLGPYNDTSAASACVAGIVAAAVSRHWERTQTQVAPSAVRQALQNDGTDVANANRKLVNARSLFYALFQDEPARLSLFTLGGVVSPTNNPNLIIEGTIPFSRGREYKLRARVSNAGTVDVRTGVVRFFVASYSPTTGSSKWSYIRSAVLSLVPVGQTVDSEVVSWIPTKAGTYTLVAIVCPSDLGELQPKQLSSDWDALLARATADGDVALRDLVVQDDFDGRKYEMHFAFEISRRAVGIGNQLRVEVTELKGAVVEVVSPGLFESYSFVAEDECVIPLALRVNAPHRVSVYIYRTRLPFLRGKCTLTVKHREDGADTICLDEDLDLPRL